MTFLVIWQGPNADTSFSLRTTARRAAARASRRSRVNWDESPPPRSMHSDHDSNVRSGQNENVLEIPTAVPCPDFLKLDATPSATWYSFLALLLFERASAPSLRPTPLSREP